MQTTNTNADQILVPGIEVSETTVADWLLAMNGSPVQVPRSRGEKVVQLRAAPPAAWSVA